MSTRLFHLANHLIDPGYRHPFFAAPAVAVGKEISYLGRSPTVLDQRYSGPCGMFAMAAVVMAARRIVIPISEIFRAYEWAIAQKNGKIGDGLYFIEVYRAAQWAGWISDKVILAPATLADLMDGPLLGGYEVNGCLDDANGEGTWDHSSEAIKSPTRGYHAMAILSYGWVGSNHDPQVTGPNSWVPFGDHGLWSCYEWLHRQKCKEMWKLKGLEVVA